MNRNSRWRMERCPLGGRGQLLGAQEQPLPLEKKFVKQFKEELNLELELHWAY